MPRAPGVGLQDFLFVPIMQVEQPRSAQQQQKTQKTLPRRRSGGQVRRKTRQKPSGSSGGAGKVESSEGGSGEATSDSPTGRGGDDARDELLQELRATQFPLQDRERVLTLTRKQLRRDTKTAKERHQQLAQRGSKAAKALSRKLFAKQARGIAGAARKERERIRKRKQPEGELLHSSARKHQRLLERGAGSSSSGGARGGAGRR